MKTSTVLKRAVKLIEKPENWIKGRLTDGHGAYCAIGAIETARFGRCRPADTKYCDTAQLFALDSNPYALWCFNDSPSTTHEDVLTAFALAIAIAEDAGD